VIAGILYQLKMVLEKVNNPGDALLYNKTD